MKKPFVILFVLVLFCFSLSAFDLSYGAFSGNGQIPKKLGGYISADVKPWSVYGFDFGFKADLLFGITKPEQRTSSTLPGIHLVYSVKAISGFQYDRVYITGGVGITSNGFKSGVAGIDTELGAAFVLNEKLSLGSSIDFIFGKTSYALSKENWFPKFDFDQPVINAARFFVVRSY